MNRKKQWLAWAKQFTAKAGGKPSATNTIQFVNLDAPAADPLEILIYGDIGSSWYDDGSVSARDFAVALAGVPAGREIVVRLNSNGGNVWDGWAIHNLLAARRSHVVCVVDGIAASIASVIALAGRELRMAEASMLMVHNASGLCMGNAEDMTEMAAALAKHDEVIAGVYARKTGKTMADVQAKMTAETWFTATDAQSFGLCDGLCEPDEPAKPANKISARGVPAAAAHNPNHPAEVSGAIQNAMNRKQLIALLNKLGLKFDAEAPDAELTALAESYTPPAPPASVPAPPPAPPAAPDAKAVVAEVQRQMRITAEVQKFANELRIPSASVADFTARALADETILTTLQAMPPRAVGAEPIDLGGEQDDKAKKMTRAAFNALAPNARMTFCKEGGRITN